MKFEKYHKHHIYSFIDGDEVDIILEGSNPDRLDRFNDYLTIGMRMALTENSDLLSQLLIRCEEVAHDE